MNGEDAGYAFARAGRQLQLKITGERGSHDTNLPEAKQIRRLLN
jgi:hypothetical protein